MKIRIALLVSAFAVLAILGAASARSVDEAWIGFQKQYAKLSRAKGGNAGAPQPIEIKQDRFLGFGEDRIDRCRSCHVAVDDPGFASEKQPLHTHPSIAPHTFTGMGCTVCHEGEGRATQARTRTGPSRSCAASTSRPPARAATRRPTCRRRPT